MNDTSCLTLNDKWKFAFLGILSLCIVGCVGVPENISPVDSFELQKYLGTWYEIARLDHSFEKGLSQVTAQYSLNEKGDVTVLNRGYSLNEGKWKEAKGKAKFVGSEVTGHLKVSFFWPFYASYVVFALDQDNYQYAMVCGPNKSFLWLLARTPHLEESIQQTLLQKAQALGFATNELIFVQH
jgi:apolipoprotein D and lipocalin family protein